MQIKNNVILNKDKRMIELKNTIKELKIENDKLKNKINNTNQIFNKNENINNEINDKKN